MTDVTEEEAVLHLKRALGELDAGDAVPRALQPVSLPPPKPKVPKTAPMQAAKAAPITVSTMMGPAAPNIPQPVKNPTWAEIRMQQEHELKNLEQQKQMQKELKKLQDAADRQKQQAEAEARKQVMHQHQAPPPQPGPVMPSDAGMKPSLAPPGGHAMPNFPGAPPLPSMPPAPTGPPQPDKNSVAAQVAAAMGPGKTQAHVDIPQAKIGMVIGKAGATLNAVKTYAKAECFIEQRTPDEDKARIHIVGNANKVEKCKMTVNALVDGTMSAATLFQLAGVPLPAGGAGEASASDRDRLGGGGITAPPPQLPAFPLGSLAGGLPPGLPFPGGMPPLGGPSTIPGMPENSQMQQNLNDYYARLWATYAHPGGDPSKAKDFGMPMSDGPAFDKEALAKLAARAAEPEPDPPPLPPDPVSEQALNPSHRGVPIAQLQDPAFAQHTAMDNGHRSSEGDLADRSSAEMRALLEASEAMSGSSGPAVSSTAGAQRKGFSPMPLKTSDPPKAKKDDDSVQKMLERLQGNVDSNKQAKEVAEDVTMQPTPVGQIRMQMRQMRGGPQASLSQMLDGGGGPHVAFTDNYRTQADVEFEALLSRLPSAQTSEEIDTLGREVLIRFPRLSTQQITELLQKIDSSTGLQNGDFQAELSRVLIPRLKEFNSSQFTTLTSTFASWSNDARGNKKKGRFSEFSKAFFMAASAEMTSRLMEYAPHEINCCLAAFVSVGFSEHRFFASVGRAALARHSSFAPVQLTALLAILSEMRLVHVDLFNASAQFLSMRAKELRPVDVIRVLRSFSKCSVHHHGMCRAIGDEVVMRVRMKTSNFKVEEIVEIAWAFCVLQFYHEDMFRTMFKELEKSPMISIDALIQLYECHLTLDCEHKDLYSRYRMDSDLAHALQDHYREYRKDERRCSERQRNDVASVLKSLVDGSVHVNHRTSTGLLVDVAALRKRSSTDGFVHVDLDSSVTVVRSLDQEENSPASIIVEGPVALRRRILAKHGLRLITVKESEWRELDDSKDKRRHLRSLLSSLGDVLE
mmetsp:Transcript_56508/g.89738  ORF Transcript_56508/g.89738 Transcript_56508/m.89738 type:complete len:1029 (+) Transcript_56508:118-3204(+)